MSTSQQEAVVLDQFNVLRRVHPDWQDAQWGGFYKDDDTCSLVSFRSRQAGSLILAASGPRDVIMASNFDRVFARPIDAYETVELVKLREIRLKILDMDVDISTDLGETFFTVMATFRGLEVKNIRRRVREALQHRARIGRPHSRAPLGWKIICVRREGRIERYFEIDRQMQGQAREIYDFHKQSGLGVRGSCELMNRLRIKCPSTKRRWSSHSELWRWLKAVENNFPLPNGEHVPAPIPPDAEPVIVQTISAYD